jgi:transcriptional regulator with XRE-family HTH domain
MFTKNLKRKREAAGFTQVEMARTLGLAQPSYNQLERGTKQPSIPIIEELIRIFGCSADELLFGGDERDEYRARGA